MCERRPGGSGSVHAKSERNQIEVRERISGHSARYILTNQSETLKWNTSTCEVEVDHDHGGSRAGKDRIGCMGVDMGGSEDKSEAPPASGK